MSEIDSESCPDKCIAIKTHSLSFGYNRTTTVINNFCIEINQGEIYALLGSNGCGKSTAIKIILGLLRPNNGSVEVFASEQVSNVNNIDISGSLFGYMPQELALFAELSVDENIRFFAKLCKITSSEMEENYNNLINLLKLIPERRVGQLSGGEQRLVSLAIALIHRPKLIILDEPTVGVDPLMVHNIWQFLKQLCRQKCHTVMITTHYIEEARAADTVAFMKSGSILEQGHPQNLINYYQKNSLEDVYLHLWHQGGETTQNTSVIKSARAKSKSNILCVQRIKIPDVRRIILLILNLHERTNRNSTCLTLLILMPLFTLVILKLSLGLTFQPIPLSIYSPESNSSLSRQFIDSFDKKTSLIREYSSEDSAIESVVKGESYVGVVFQHNFTHSLETRLQYPLEITDELIDSSNIKLFIDSSNQVILYRAYQYLGQSLFHVLNKQSYPSLPITIEETVYGTNPILEERGELFNFLTPCVLSNVDQFSIMVLASSVLIEIFENGFLNRYRATGGTSIEIIIAIYTYVTILNLIQSLFVLICAGLIFNMKQEGSWFQLYALYVMQSMGGMSINLFIALLFKDGILSSVATGGFLLPQYFISGLFWPIEGMPNYLRLFCDWSLLTKPLEAVRSITLRGWHLGHTKVFIGFITSSIYTITFTILNVFLSYYHE